MRTLFLLIALLPALAAEPPAVRFPKPPTPPSIPVAMPSADAPLKLAKGKWYVFDSDFEMFPDQFALGTGAVTITPRKGTLTLPAEFAVGREADKDDPTVVTIKGPFIYVVKAAATGKVMLDVIPSLPRLDKDSKPIPFAREDIYRKILDVEFDGGGTDDTDTKKPVTELTKLLQAALTAEGATAASAKKLAGFYRIAAKKTAYDTTLATGAAMLKEMKDAVQWIDIPHDSMKGTALVIANELKKTFEKTTGNLDQPTRDKLSAAFLTIANSLEVLK